MDEETEKFKVFVGGVSWMTTEESLREHFEKFGAVARVAIARDRYTGGPRGFAFVSFTDQSAFDNALLVEHHHILGRTVCYNTSLPFCMYLCVCMLGICLCVSLLVQLAVTLPPIIYLFYLCVQFGYPVQRL